MTHSGANVGDRHRRLWLKVAAMAVICILATAGSAQVLGPSNIRLPDHLVTVRSGPPNSAASHALASPPFEVTPVAIPTWAAPLATPLIVARDFDPPITRYGRGHRGVDLAAEAGSTVSSAGSGTVLWAGPLAGRGVVSVHHGVVRTTYEPVQASVSVGDEVVVGAALGLLEEGHQGCRAAACLHWGLRTDTDYFDPFGLLLGTVRLLPQFTPAGEPVGRSRAAARP